MKGQFSKLTGVRNRSARRGTIITFENCSFRPAASVCSEESCSRSDSLILRLRLKLELDAAAGVAAVEIDKRDAAEAEESAEAFASLPSDLAALRSLSSVRISTSSDSEPLGSARGADDSSTAFDSDAAAEAAVEFVGAAVEADCDFRGEEGATEASAVLASRTSSATSSSSRLQFSAN